MQGRYALLVAFQGLLVLLALLLQLTALTQPLFVVHEQSMLGGSVRTVVGFEDLGLLYFIFFLALIALTVFTRITMLRWGNSLRSTPLLAYAIVFLIILSMWPLLLQISPPNIPGILDGFSAYYLPLEGFYTYSLSSILLVAALALGPPIAARRVSFSGAMKTT